MAGPCSRDLLGAGFREESREIAVPLPQTCAASSPVCTTLKMWRLAGSSGGRARAFTHLARKRQVEGEVPGFGTVRATAPSAVSLLGE